MLPQSQLRPGSWLFYCPGSPDWATDMSGGVKSAERRQTAGHSRRAAFLVFALGVVMYVIINIQRVAVPGQIFNELQSDLGVSASAVANLGASFMYVYSATQLLTGLLVDKYGGIRILAGGSLLMGIGAVMFPLAGSLTTLTLSRILVGIGGGTIYLSVVKETERLYGHRFTTTMGVVIFLGYSGGIFATLPFSLCVGWLGWRLSMGLIGIAGLFALTGIALLWSQAPRPPIVPARITPAAYWHAFTNFNNLKVIFSYTAMFGIYYTILTVFGKKFLVDIGGVSNSAAALCCTVMVIFSAILNQVTGLLSAYTGTARQPYIRTMISFSLAGVALVTAVLCLAGGAPASGRLLMLAFLVICLSSGFAPITNSLMRELNPPGMTGVAVGVLNFAAYAMVAMMSNLAGLILDLFAGRATVLADGSVIYPLAAYRLLFVIFLLIAIKAFLVGRTLPETHSQNICDGKTVRFTLFKLITLKLHT